MSTENTELNAFVGDVYMGVLKKTVFLVDDDKDDLALALRVLKGAEGLSEVVPLSSGQSLFEELKIRGLFEPENALKAKQSMIILDLHMPGDSGIEILQLLKDNPYTSDIPVLMLTEDAGTSQIEQTYNMQANGYFTKPLRDNHLNIIQSIFRKGENWQN